MPDSLPDHERVTVTGADATLAGVADPPFEPVPAVGVPPWVFAMLAAAAGAVGANLYYSQALIGLIGPAVGLRGDLAGLVVTSTQLGYALGLALIAPLSDLIENRRLILVCLAAATIGLLGMALSRDAAPFIAASLVVGIGSVAIQVMVPYAAHLAPEATRGRLVGNVMGGLIAGIMLARPAASIIAHGFGWRAIFFVSAVAMAAVAVVLRISLPRRRPEPGPRYGEILVSMLRLMATEPRLQARTAYQTIAFTAFSLFWTAIPLLLQQRFGFGQQGIALFALAGAGGALSAPVAGRMADRGWIRRATVAALVVVPACFGLAALSVSRASIVGLGIAAITLDAAVQMNQVVGQRVIYSLAPEVRGRINAIYMTVVFVGASCGSLLATITYDRGGFPLTAAAGATLGMAGLLAYALTRRAAA